MQNKLIWITSGDDRNLRRTKQYSLIAYTNIDKSSYKVWMFNSLSFVRSWGDKLFVAVGNGRP